MRLTGGIFGIIRLRFWRERTGKTLDGILHMKFVFFLFGFRYLFWRERTGKTLDGILHLKFVFFLFGFRYLCD